MKAQVQSIEAREDLIGKSYWPIDNSKAICLNDTESDYFLAGHNLSEPKQQEEVTIVLPPFWAQCYAHRSEEDNGQRLFVVVRCNRGLLHRVMFFEHALAPQAERPSAFIEHWI